MTRGDYVRIGSNSISSQKRKLLDETVQNQQANRWNVGQHAERVLPAQQNQTKPSEAVKSGKTTASGISGGVGGGGGRSAAVAPGNSYTDQLNALYDQIINRGEFQYDLNGDLLYRQMADQYSQLGRQAMRDATGTAAGLTGGYANSYANLVGNQANQQYLTQLNSIIPELYDRAYNEWLNEGDLLLQRYNLASGHKAALDALAPKTSGSGSDSVSNEEVEVPLGYSAGESLGSTMASLPIYAIDPTSLPGYSETLFTDYYPALAEELKNKKKK